MTDITKFHVITDEEKWESYLSEVLKTLPGIKEIRIKPKEYPCLVAGITSDTQEISFCFVYKDDAMALLKHVFDDPDDIHVKDSTTINPFALALFLELESIGAIKADRFQQAMEFCLDALDKDSLVYDSLDEFLQEMIKSYHAD